MALPVKQTVSISLTGGVNTKTDPKQLAGGKVLRLENAVFTSPGRIKKRNGYAALGQGIVGDVSTLRAATGLASYLMELLLADGTSLYSYDAANDSWVNKGKYVPAKVTLSPVVRNTYQQQSPDGATHSTGLQCFAWEDSQGGVRYSVVDGETGLNIVHDQPVDSVGNRPKVLAFGNYLLVFYVVESSTTLFFKTINVATPTALGTATPVTNQLTSQFSYDVSVVNQRLFIAYDRTPVGV